MLKFPLYNAMITDSDEGLFCVSLVSDPATEVNFVCFGEDKPIVKFAVEDKMERLVSGIIMLADTPIYRRTSGGYEYYINFTKDVLKTMAEKMIYDGVGSSINIQHQDNSNVEGINLVELFVIDREKGIAPTYFSEVPDGSLVGTYKVHNDEVWSMIENGEVLSFSLEGIFNMVEVEFNKQNKTQNKNNFFMKINKFKQALRKLLAEFSSVATDKGTLVWDGDEDLKEGDAVHTVDEEGNDIAVEDGDYNSEDGKLIITVQDGKVTAIKEVEKETEEVEPTTDETDNSEEVEAEETTEPTEPSNESVEEVVEETPNAEIEALRTEIAELRQLIGELTSRVEKVEGAPVAKSAEEEFAAITDTNTKAGKMKQRGYRF